MVIAKITISAPLVQLHQPLLAVAATGVYTRIKRRLHSMPRFVDGAISKPFRECWVRSCIATFYR
jgi:hypothetical protein